MWPDEELQHIPFVAERRVRSETKKSEDFLLLKNDDIEKVAYEHGRPASLSYTNIEETRSYRSHSSGLESAGVNLLWRQKEFRASIYDGDKKRPYSWVEPTITHRETDPVPRRSSTLHETTAGNLQKFIHLSQQLVKKTMKSTKKRNVVNSPKKTKNVLY
jgi:hypothetical protein